MNVGNIRRFRRLLRELRLEDASTEFAAALGAEDSPRSGSLLVVGTPEFEPWHFVAHLADEARASGRLDLVPTWIRWAPPTLARGHLAISFERLAETRRGDTILVIAPNSASEQLLDRVSDARDSGGRVLTLNRDDRDLVGLAHEALVVPSAARPQIFDVVQHLVANTAPGATVRRGRRGRVAKPVLPGGFHRLMQNGEPLSGTPRGHSRSGTTPGSLSPLVRGRVRRR